MKSPCIWRHGKPADWCHLCGKRSDYTADVWWAENAEHDRKFGNRHAAAAGRYVRICDACAATIAAVALGTIPGTDREPMDDMAKRPSDQ